MPQVLCHKVVSDSKLGLFEKFNIFATPFNNLKNPLGDAVEKMF